MAALQTTIVVILCLYMAVSVGADDTTSVMDETRLLQDLLDPVRYDKRALPRYNRTSNVAVEVGISAQHLLELNERMGYMAFLYWTLTVWKDLRLTWNESLYGDIQSIRIPTGDIWFPDIKPYNSARRDHSLTQSETGTVVVYSDGKITHLGANSYETTCDFDMRHFPYDVQRCVVKMGSWTYDGSDIYLQDPSDVDFSNYQPHHAWEVLSTRTKRNVQHYDCCPEPYMDVTFLFVLRRRPGFFRDLYIIPAILLASLVPFIFALPVTRVHRYVLGGFLLLVFNQLLMAFDSNIPTTNGGTPLLGQLFSCLEALAAVSLLVSAVLTNLADRGTYRFPPPGFLTKIIIDGLGRVLCISQTKPAHYENAGNDDDDGGASSGKPSPTWLTMAQILDRLFFWVYCLAYIIMAIAFAAIRSQ